MAEVDLPMSAIQPRRALSWAVRMAAPRARKAMTMQCSTIHGSRNLRREMPG